MAFSARLLIFNCGISLGSVRSGRPVLRGVLLPVPRRHELRVRVEPALLLHLLPVPAHPHHSLPHQRARGPALVHPHRHRPRQPARIRHLQVGYLF